MEWPISWEDVKKELTELRNGLWLDVVDYVMKAMQSENMRFHETLSADEAQRIFDTIGSPNFRGFAANGQYTMTTPFGNVVDNKDRRTAKAVEFDTDGSFVLGIYLSITLDTNQLYFEMKMPIESEE